MTTILKKYLTKDDIIFENRNKSYGAYQIRNEQDARTMKAITSTFLLLLSLLLIFEVRNIFAGDQKYTERVVDLTPIDNDFEIKPDKKTEPEQPKQDIPQAAKAATIAYNDVNVVHDNTPNTTIIANQDILFQSSSNIGNTTQTGTIDMPVIDPNTLTQSGTGTGNIVDAVIPVTTTTSTPVTYLPVNLQEKPEFEGGEAALMKYMRKNISYPEMAERNGIEGKVIVEFIVEADGNINEVKILKEPGYGLGTEAMRVIKKMPKWKPGKQGDAAVRCKYTYPIQFNLPR